MEESEKKAELLRFIFGEDGMTFKVSHWPYEEPDFDEVARTVIDHLAPVLLEYGHARGVGETDQDKFVDAMTSLSKDAPHSGNLVLSGEILDDGRIDYSWECDIPEKFLNMAAVSAYYCFDNLGTGWDEQ